MHQLVLFPQSLFPRFPTATLIQNLGRLARPLPIPPSESPHHSVVYLVSEVVHIIRPYQAALRAGALALQWILSTILTDRQK
jgi:hypothetical protein